MPRTASPRFCLSLSYSLFLDPLLLVLLLLHLLFLLLVLLLLLLTFPPGERAGRVTGEPRAPGRRSIAPVDRTNSEILGDVSLRGWSRMMNLSGARCVESLGPLRAREQSSRVAGQSAGSRVFTVGTFVLINIFETIRTRAINYCSDFVKIWQQKRYTVVC